MILFETIKNYAPCRNSHKSQRKVDNQNVKARVPKAPVKGWKGVFPDGAEG